MNRCTNCNRFFSWQSDYDSYTPFGSSSDLEPPDEIYVCAVCSKKIEDEYVLSKRIYSNWIPSKAERRAAKRLGFVQAGPKGAAWSEWFSPNKIPLEYEVRK